MGRVYIGKDSYFDVKSVISNGDYLLLCGDGFSKKVKVKGESKIIFNRYRNQTVIVKDLTCKSGSVAGSVSSLISHNKLYITGKILDEIHGSYTTELLPRKESDKSYSLSVKLSGSFDAVLCPEYDVNLAGNFNRVEFYHNGYFKGNCSTALAYNATLLSKGVSNEEKVS